MRMRIPTVFLCCGFVSYRTMEVYYGTNNISLGKKVRDKICMFD
jgi:hypothetical protein